MKGRLLAKNSLMGVVVAVAVAFFLLPVVWIVITSFKSQGEVFHYPPIFRPKLPPIWNACAVCWNE